ncbi:MAG: hypothetical protein JXA51_00285 [Dehalococcoidales bacterium]|nr:hypothetical protein [Dehalococcoidales bacterium]
MGIALILAAVMWGAYAIPAGALDLDPEDYLELEYDPITFDKSEITGGEVFQVTISGRVTCHQDLPAILPVREAEIDSQVVARHEETGAQVTLNTGYTVKIKPFPDDAGDSIDISQTVPSQFPSQAVSGNYTVIGRIIKARVKFILGSMDVTEFLPGEQPMGTITYTAPSNNPTPASPAPPEQETTPVPEPSDTTSPGNTPAPAGESAPQPATTTATMPEPEQVIPWWVGPVVFIAIAVTVLNIAWFISQRLKKRVN